MVIQQLATAAVAVSVAAQRGSDAAIAVRAAVSVARAASVPSHGSSSLSFGKLCLAVLAAVARPPRRTALTRCLRRVCAAFGLSYVASYFAAECVSRQLLIAWIVIVIALDCCAGCVRGKSLTAVLAFLWLFNTIVTVIGAATGNLCSTAAEVLAFLSFALTGVTIVGIAVWSGGRACRGL